MDHETAVLRRFLDEQRRHVVGILEGLTEEQLRRSVLPSGWHCLGMVRHLALSDEHYWFRCVMNGESLDYFPAGPNADFQLGPDETAGDVFALDREEIAHADAIIAANSLNQPPRQPDPQWQQSGLELPDLRTVIQWVTRETATHAGHLDAVRELIDGRQWIVLQHPRASRYHDPSPSRAATAPYQAAPGPQPRRTRPPRGPQPRRTSDSDGANAAPVATAMAPTLLSPSKTDYDSICCHA
jgi:hypothetical protein